MLESAIKASFFIIIAFIVFFLFFRFLFTNSLNNEDSDSASPKPANDNSLLNWKITGGLLVCLNLVFFTFYWTGGRRCFQKSASLISKEPWLIYPHIFIIVATVIVFYIIWKKGKKEQKEQVDQIKKRINIPKLVLQIIGFSCCLIIFYYHYIRP